VAAAVRREIAGEIVHHNGAVDGICTSLDILLAGRTRPTALLVARSGYALTVHTHLLRRGVRIPQDMAVLCRDDDAFLDWVVPRMTRYAVSPVAFAKRIYHLVIKLVEEGRAKETGVKVVPAFLGRESV
jgi:DNA-binding LacI/PurR family transcriptional regulator